jgi:hypothetical protein
MPHTPDQAALLPVARRKGLHHSGFQSRILAILQPRVVSRCRTVHRCFLPTGGSVRLARCRRVTGSTFFSHEVFCIRSPKHGGADWRDSTPASLIKGNLLKLLAAAGAATTHRSASKHAGARHGFRGWQDRAIYCRRPRARRRAPMTDTLVSPRAR